MHNIITAKESAVNIPGFASLLFMNFLWTTDKAVRPDKYMEPSLQKRNVQ
jgi:hypothetical protein